MKGLQGTARAAGAAWTQEGGTLAGGGQTVKGDTFSPVSWFIQAERADERVSTELWSAVRGCRLSVTVMS